MLASLIIAAVVLVIDQLSKIAVVSGMEVSQSIPVIQDVLHMTYVQNRGMAFGLFSDNRMLFMIPTVVLIAAVVFAIVKLGKKNKVLDVSLGLILGGGIGNMIDRVARGFVVDFVDFCAFDFWQWVFNVADSAVVVGAFLFMFAMITDKNLFPDDKKKSGEENE
jgi:signal peptidase II